MENRYQQELARVLNVFENVLITLSCISPASAVFIVVPVAFAGFGELTLWSYLVATLIGVAMAFCWAELGSIHSFSGGDYSIVTRVLGSTWGFANFGLQVATIVCVPPLFALGLASYLKVLVDLDPTLVAMITILLATVVAMLRVRIGATITGIFLAIELIALVVLAYLGLSHIERPISDLFIPHSVDAGGTNTPATVGLVMAGVAVAIFSFDGYRAAVNLGEETLTRGKGVAHATLWALVVTAIAEIIPLVAVMLGATSIAQLGRAPDLTAFVSARGGAVVNLWMSLAVAGAILNALIAIIIVCSRVLYSSGRDLAWPGPVNTSLAYVHPRYRTPWIACAALGGIGVGITPFANAIALGNLLGALVTLAYMMIAYSAIISRIKEPGLDRPYRMPLWPLPPVFALAAMAYVMTRLGRWEIIVTGGVLVLSLVYYYGYLERRLGLRWRMKSAPE